MPGSAAVFSTHPLFRPEGCGYPRAEREFSGFLKNCAKKALPFEKTAFRESSHTMSCPGGRARTIPSFYPFTTVKFKQIPAELWADSAHLQPLFRSQGKRVAPTSKL